MERRMVGIMRRDAEHTGKKQESRQDHNNNNNNN